LPAAIPGRFLVTDEQEIAGGCLNYLRDKLFFPDDEFGQQAPQDTFQRFDEMAARIPAGSENLIFTPWLYGERTPVDDELIRGGFFNQSLRHTRGHLVRAVFEGVAYNARWLLGFVEKFAKRRLDPIYIVGGGAQSDIWCQIHADIFNRTILQVQDPLHVNAHGAALLASLALGALRVDEIRQRVPIERTYQPDPANRGIYERLFKEFVNLYDLHRPLHARLNRA
jgi:xylulokinase